MMDFIIKVVAVIATMVVTVGLLMGKVTLLGYIFILSTCWIVLPLFIIIVLPCLIGLVAWLWNR